MVLVEESLSLPQPIPKPPVRWPRGPWAGRAMVGQPGYHAKLLKPGSEQKKRLDGPKAPTSPHTDVLSFQAATPDQLPLVPGGQVWRRLGPGERTFSLEKCSWARGCELWGRWAGAGEMKASLQGWKGGQPVSYRAQERAFFLKSSPLSLQLSPATEHGGTTRRHRAGSQR